MKYTKYLEEALVSNKDQIIEECERNGDVIEVRTYNSETNNCWHFKIGNVKAYTTMLASQFDEDFTDAMSAISAIQMIMEQKGDQS